MTYVTYCIMVLWIYNISFFDKKDIFSESTHLTTCNTNLSQQIPLNLVLLLRPNTIVVISQPTAHSFTLLIFCDDHSPANIQPTIYGLRYV